MGGAENFFSNQNSIFLYGVGGGQISSGMRIYVFSAKFEILGMHKEKSFKIILKDRG